MSELLPCPFCGGRQTYRKHDGAVWLTTTNHKRGCIMRDALSFVAFDTETEAIAAWNTRHEDTCRMEPLNAFYTDLNGLNQTEWGVCSNCGTASPIDATYCCECGRKVER